MTESIFIVGLLKSGSTLLNRIMRPLAESTGLVSKAPANELFKRGLELRDARVTFEPFGHAYGGFRGMPWPLPPFAANRTVLLVRDPRDALTSLYFSVAYSHRLPGATDSPSMLQAFDARRAEARAMSIDAFVLEEAAGHARHIKKTLANLPAHRLYRYEDVIFDKLTWTRDMLDYLGLSVAERLVGRVVGMNDVTPSEESPLEHIRRVTPGDHRLKLRAETIATLDDRFKGIMRRLGYAGKAP